MHFQLRTEGGSAPNKGASVALGVFIGCLPLYGLHLALCFGVARLLRLSRLRTYLAAHINNPLSGPFLVSLELALGHRLIEGSWPDLRPAQIPSLGAIGSHLAVGSLALGLVLAVVLGAIAFVIARRWRSPGFTDELRERTSRLYLGAGIFDWEFVRGKLRWDPLYFALLRRGILPRSGRLLDLGSGRGIVSALLRTAREMAAEGRYPSDWSPPPVVEVVAFERNPKALAAARQALGEEHAGAAVDLTAAKFPPTEGALLFDVLHYLPADGQRRLVASVAAALAPAGLLILREADADGGLRFLCTRIAERLAALARGHWRQRFHYRSADGWRQLLTGAGLDCLADHPMATGTPYSNILLVARRPPTVAG